LNHEHEKCVVATPDPTVPVGYLQKTLYFFMRKICDYFALIPFCRNREDLPDEFNLFRNIKGYVVKKRMNRSQPLISTANTNTTVVLEMSQEAGDKPGIQLLQFDTRGRPVVLFLRIL